MTKIPAGEMRSDKPQHGFFAMLLGLSLVVFWKPLWSLGQFVSQSEQYSHILLVPFVTLALFYQDRGRILSSVRPDRVLGSIGIGLGTALYLLHLLAGNNWSENDQASLAVFSVVLIWLGLFVFFYGRGAFRRAAFPLLFLFLIVPIPEFALNAVIGFLQRASAEMTDILFNLTGVPVYRQGMTFELPGIAIEVARECSGIRSTLALFITSLLAAHLFLRTWSRKAILWAAVVPITIFKNGVRIVALSLLAVYVDPAILDSTAHRRGGIPIFGLALLLLGAVLWLLRRTERTSLPAEGKEAN